MLTQYPFSLVSKLLKKKLKRRQRFTLVELRPERDDSQDDRRSGNSTTFDQDTGSDVTRNGELVDQGTGSDVTRNGQMVDQTTGSDVTRNGEMVDQTTGSDDDVTRNGEIVDDVVSVSLIGDAEIEVGE